MPCTITRRGFSLRELYLLQAHHISHVIPSYSKRKGNHPPPGRHHYGLALSVTFLDTPSRRFHKARCKNEYFTGRRHAFYPLHFLDRQVLDILEKYRQKSATTKVRCLFPRWIAFVIIRDVSDGGIELFLFEGCGSEYFWYIDTR